LPERYRSYFGVLLVFVIFALAYSLLALLHPQPSQHLHEYSLGNLAKEVSGHFVFGFACGIALGELGFALLAGSMAVLIDVDHLLGILNIESSGRPDHSLLFAALVSAVMYYAGRRLSFTRSALIKLVALGPMVLVAHLSYDVFAATYIEPGPGNQFPLFLPFNFSSIVLPSWSWLPLEVSGIVLGFAAFFAARKGSVELSARMNH